jgi:type IV secretion system protein VirB8
MAEGSLSQDESVTMFSVVRYVKARETYDPKALKDNFDLAQLLSTGTASRDLTEIYSPANPRNPVKQFGGNTEISVNVKSVTFPNQRAALVRFSTEEKSASNVVRHDWVSLVRFRYSGVPMSNQMRFDNPLGFQATEYRRDQETAPSPNTGAAQTGAQRQ